MLCATAAIQAQVSLFHNPQAIINGAMPIITIRNNPGSTKLETGSPSNISPGNPIKAPLGSASRTNPPPMPPNPNKISKMMSSLKTPGRIASS